MSPAIFKNLILADLPPPVLEALRADLIPITLPSGTELYQPHAPVDWVYFPVRGMISVVQAVPGSREIQVATIGREGVLGAMAGLGNYHALSRSFVQVPIIGYKIFGKRFRALVQQHPDLADVALRSNDALLAQAQVAAACHALHPVSQRISRWLLRAQNCAETDVLAVTQSDLADLLGLRRTSVTEFNAQLEHQGLIRTVRGKIEILNRSGLRLQACQCSDLACQTHYNVLQLRPDRDSPEPAPVLSANAR